MTHAEEQLEPAQHDDPENGPKQGWKAADMVDVPDATDDQIVQETELVADGNQERVD
jgi:hypothetical protein